MLLLLLSERASRGVVWVLRKVSTARSLCCTARVSGAKGCAKGCAGFALAFALSLLRSSTTIFGVLGDLFFTAGFFAVAAAALLRFVAGSAPVSSPEEVVAALRLRPVVFFAACSSGIPCVVSAGALLPIVPGGEESSLLGEGGELGGIVLSLVLSTDSRCCARWSFGEASREPVKAARFFGGMLRELLDLVRMIAAPCEMREL